MRTQKDENKIKPSAAVVVLYYPDDEVMENINSYINEVDRIYLVDNSEFENPQFENLEKIIYMPMNENLGLCSGLNVGCKKAIEDGAKVIVTLNQDTYCPIGTIKTLVEKQSKETKRVFGTNFKYIYRNGKERNFSDEAAFPDQDENVIWTITAGNSFTSEAFENVGGFDDKLFIDNLDRDFGFRLIEKGYTIIRLGNVFIYQEPGRTSKVSLGFKTLHIPNLSPLRYFYIFRNEKYLRDKYGNQYDRYKVNLFKYLVSIIFFENNKTKKLKECIGGYRIGKKLTHVDMLSDK